MMLGTQSVYYKASNIANLQSASSSPRSSRNNTAFLKSPVSMSSEPSPRVSSGKKNRSRNSSAKSSAKSSEKKSSGRRNGNRVRKRSKEEVAAVNFQIDGLLDDMPPLPGKDEENHSSVVVKDDHSSGRCSVVNEKYTSKHAPVQALMPRLGRSQSLPPQSPAQDDQHLNSSPPMKDRFLSPIKDDQSTHTSGEKQGISSSDFELYYSFKGNGFTDDRTRTATEILHSEATYVKHLQFVGQLYTSPLAYAAEDPSSLVITTAEIETIFNNVQLLCTFNSYFLQNLHERLKSWTPDETKLGDVFLQFAPFFRMYSQYVTNYEEVPDIVDGLMNRNSKFVEFCQLAQEDPRCENDILSLLIMPIQRIPRYKLLLESLVKATPKEHIDYEGLTNALALVSKVTRKIDEDIAVQQSNRSIRKFERQFTEPVSFMAPHRRLIRRGVLTKPSCNGDQDFEFFLFNDILGFATFKGSGDRRRFRLIHTHDLHDFTTVQAVNIFEAEANNDEEEMCLFILTGHEESMVLGCRDGSEAEGWIDDLRTCLAQKPHSRRRTTRTSSSTLALQAKWKPDDSATHCPLCEVAFRFFVRRHHCRNCGDVICGSCSRKRRILLPDYEIPVRVCDKCDEDKCGEEYMPQRRGGDIGRVHLRKGQDINLEKWYTEALEFCEQREWNKAVREKVGEIQYWRLDHPVGDRQSVKGVALVKTTAEQVCKFVRGHGAPGMYHNTREVRSYGNTQLVHCLLKTAGSFWYSATRDFSMITDWQKNEDGSYCVVAKSVSSPLIPPQPEITRGRTILNAWFIRPVKSAHFQWCEVTMLTQWDPKGWVPKWLKTNTVLEHQRILNFVQSQAPRGAQKGVGGPRRSQRKISSWHGFLKECGIASHAGQTTPIRRPLSRTKITPPKDLGSVSEQDGSPRKVKKGVARSLLLEVENSADNNLDATNDHANNQQSGPATEPAGPSLPFDSFNKENQAPTDVNKPINGVEDLDELVMGGPLTEVNANVMRPSEKEVLSSIVKESETQGYQDETKIKKLIGKLLAKNVELSKANKGLREQLLQVKDFLDGQRGKTLERLELDLSESNLALCQAKSENDKLVLKLEKMQESLVKTRKEKKALENAVPPCKTCAIRKERKEKKERKRSGGGINEAALMSLKSL